MNRDEGEGDAIGGINHTQRLSREEKYNISHNQRSMVRSMVRSMHRTRFDAGRERVGWGGSYQCCWSLLSRNREVEHDQPHEGCQGEGGGGHEQRAVLGG